MQQIAEQSGHTVLDSSACWRPRPHFPDLNVKHPVPTNCSDALFPFTFSDVYDVWRTMVDDVKLWKRGLVTARDASADSHSKTDDPFPFAPALTVAGLVNDYHSSNSILHPDQFVDVTALVHSLWASVQGSVDASLPSNVQSLISSLQYFRTFLSNLPLRRDIGIQLSRRCVDDYMLSGGASPFPTGCRTALWNMLLDLRGKVDIEFNT